MLDLKVRKGLPDPQGHRDRRVLLDLKVRKGLPDRQGHRDRRVQLGRRSGRMRFVLVDIIVSALIAIVAVRVPNQKTTGVPHAL